MCFAPQCCAIFWHPDLQKWPETLMFSTFWPGNVLRATMACTFVTSEHPKVIRSGCVLYILTWKCAWHHNGVQKVLRTWCALCILTLKCASPPQRRALFRHQNFQKWSESGVCCTFWLEQMLRATTPCTFSSGHMAPHPPLSTFRPSRPTNHWQNTVFRDFPNISPTCIFFLPTLSLSLFYSFSLLLFLSSTLSLFYSSLVFSFLLFSLLLFSTLLSSTLLFSLTLPLSAFHLSIVSEVWLLNFLWLICRIRYIYIYLF